MAFLSEIGSGSARATNKHDLLNKIVQAMTSQHVATVAVNAGGSGYVVGDEVTLAHASAHLAARFEVTTVSSGAITGLRIVSSGAYAQQAASATVNAGGSNYAVGDVIEVGGGTSRCPAKFQVATLSGSAVATVTLFEGGGAYSSTPSNPATTTKVGPAAGTGSGCTLDVTYQSIIGTTGLSVTGGSGSSATVDITLAETGWSVNGRNTNSASFNSITNEKQVVLVGDATGRTNKPYIGFATGTSISGINTRHFIQVIGLIAHNPAVALSAQANIHGDPGTFSSNKSYILCDENALQEMNFWLTIDDLRVAGAHNINSGATNTDDGQYLFFYAGFLDTFATEIENPYPMMVGASARQQDVNPSTAQVNIGGPAECPAPTSNSSGWWWYRVETSTWVSVINSVNFATNTDESHVMAPMAKLDEPTAASVTAPFHIATYGPLNFYTGIGSTGRASATRRLMPVPGTTPKPFPIPLTLLSRPGSTTIDQVLDTPRGQMRGFYWVYNTNAAAATISNFSEDYITIGSDRYRVFHNHVHTEPYQFLCIREDV